ncbi:MAG: Gfo/Idh/MocA family oxidoreductase [Thermodesulfobacteriota bacterium]|nr:Gfo/Idh/MocA family oxidoreductase [Thermodesulfobacteriota bacterium]
MQKVKVGVVGVGYLGQYHAEKYASMAEADLIGVVDIDKKRAHEIAEKYGAKPYTNYKDLIGKVEAVSVVVPTTLHYPVAGHFLRQGIDVLLEKPMTCTLSEASRLIKLAKAKNLILQVGHLERFNPAVVALRDHLENPLFIESHRLSTFKGRGIDVDVVLDLMIHDIDIILNIVKSKLKNIHAVGVPVITPNTDIANVRLEFENGCTANVTVSRISNKNMRKIRIFQPNAYLSVDYARREIVVIKKTTQNGMYGFPGIEEQVASFPESDSLAEELRAFVSSVRTRKPPVVSGEDGQRALHVALKIMKQINRTIGNLGRSLNMSLPEHACRVS